MQLPKADEYLPSNVSSIRFKTIKKAVARGYRLKSCRYQPELNLKVYTISPAVTKRYTL
ncbi:hypothetical protein FB99_30400 [Pantoea agglomerans]|nr:hypothetical protein FB99_30400 [Pantoea agglomerans]